MKGKFSAAVLVLCFQLSIAGAQEIPVKLFADKLCGNVNKKVEAHGRVVVKFKDVVVRGDNASYDKLSGILRVWGNVEIVEGDVDLNCRSLIYDLKSKRAVLEKVKGRLSLTDYIKADRIERLSEKEWIAYDGEYTPCKGQTCPDWSVGAKKFRVLLGESFSGKWVTFRIKEIPIVAMPVLNGSIARKRTSGFLTPKVGYVSEGGFYYRQPFYLVLGRSADLTVAYEKRFRGGNGKSSEFRYVLSPYSKGSVFLNKLNLPSEKSWKFTFDHSYRPSDYAYGTAHAEVINSRSYYKATTTFDVEEKTQIYTKSNANFSKLWKHALINANVVYLDYLDGSTDDIYQKLPNLQFYLMDVPINGFPFTFNFAGDATYFYRKAGGSSYRVNLEPGLRYVRTLDKFKSSTQVAYSVSDYEVGGSKKIFKFENKNSFNVVREVKGVGDFSVTPWLGFKVYDVMGSGNNVIFDLNDKVEDRREAFWGAEAYFYSLGRQIGRLNISGGYDFKGEDNWKDWKVQLSITPVYDLTFQQDLKLSSEDGSLETANTYMGFPLRVGEYGLDGGMGWVDFYYQKEEPQVKYVRWGTSIPINRYLSFSFQQRYDVRYSMDRERDYSLTVNRGCWNGEISYKWIKNYDGSIDYQVMLMVNLMKLGGYGYRFAGRRED